MTKENGIYKADYQPDLVGAHKVYVLLTDKYQNKKTLAESILYASDFLCFSCFIQKCKWRCYNIP
ncbi:MAG: hypothetical protein L6V93_01935 [Clostridiales bacterium]|nr:MAG: hypothetical protein L6V93_01935 [Clostridiales bacterium]